MQFVVTAAQFFDELPQARRQFGAGAQALLQPFADGVADRYTRLVIDLFEIVIASIHWQPLTSSNLAALARLECQFMGQVTAVNLVSRAQAPAFYLRGRKAFPANSSAKKAPARRPGRQSGGKVQSDQKQRFTSRQRGPQGVGTRRRA